MKKFMYISFMRSWELQPLGIWEKSAHIYIYIYILLLLLLLKYTLALMFDSIFIFVMRVYFLLIFWSCYIGFVVQIYYY